MIRYNSIPKIRANALIIVPWTDLPQLKKKRKRKGSVYLRATITRKVQLEPLASQNFGQLVKS